MAHEFSVRCDALLPDGNKCETRKPISTASGVPEGWSVLLQHRKATSEDVEILEQMRPMLEAAREDPDTGAKVVESMDQMTANMIEKMPAVRMQSFICPDHELPKATGSADRGILPVY